MRAATLIAPGRIVVDDFPIPSCGPGQVLVRTEHSSICGSDLHTVFGGMQEESMLGRPGYPGHEGAGVVVESNSNDVPVGARVLTLPDGPRGQCFAEYQALDAAKLVIIPESLDLRTGLMAQQVGTTVYALKKFLRGLDSPETAVVIGAGSAGLYFTQQLSRRGMRVIVSDLNSDRLEVVARHGADVTVHEPEESVAEIVRDLTGGAGADLVIEAAGYDATRAIAVDAVRRHGTIGLFGFPESRGLAPFPVNLSFRKAPTMEWTVSAQSEPGLLSFRQAIEMIASGEIDVSPCLEVSYPLEEMVAAFEFARSHAGGHPKVNLSLI